MSLAPLHKKYTWLTGNRVSFLVICIAVVARCIQLLFFYNIRVDASYQVMATDNLLHGHGISTGLVRASNLAETVYTPLTQWPPGYSLLLAPFYVLFQHRYIPAGIALDIAAAIGLILYSRKILQLLDTPIYLVNVFTLLNGFFIYYFYFIASSDAIAISFFAAGIYYALRLVKTGKGFALPTIALVFTLFIAGLIKYLFIPVVFVVPLFLLYSGLAEKNRQLQKAGLSAFIALFLSLGGLLWDIKNISGSVAYVSSPERGLYLNHWLEIYPFLTASFVKPDTMSLMTKEILSISFFYCLSQWITLLLACVLTFLLVRQMRKNPFSSYAPADLFFFLAFFLSLAVTLVLMALSLVVAKEEILPGSFWTYVEEPRYYGLVNILVHLGVFVFYQYTRKKSNVRAKQVFVLLLLLLLPEFLRGVLFDLNRLRRFGKEEYSWQYEKRLQDYADSLVQQIRQEQKNIPLVVAGTSYYYNHRISLASHVPILYDSLSLQKPAALKASQPVQLLIMLNESAVPSYQSLLTAKGLQPIGKFEQFLFYTTYVGKP